MVSIGMPAYITYAGSLLEYFVFTVDIVCFVVFVLKEAIVLIRQIVYWQTAQSSEIVADHRYPNVRNVQPPIPSKIQDCDSADLLSARTRGSVIVCRSRGSLH